ncbi:MAG: HAMP domain-containing histidine kinase [Proteobacteria bacterium]|nr:HAMP domain-containing histidine kinase [Pseudomonadota bacterium]
MPSPQPFNSPRSYQQSAPDAWYRLRLFNYYRSSLALFFVAIYLNGWLEQLIPSRFAHAELFITTSSIYFIASLFFITGMIRKKPGLDTQVIIHTLVDISCIILLMHATGGIRTGMGMLLIISISMTSLFLHKRVTILFASISALAIIAEQIYSQLTYIDYTPAFTQAGLLGILIFITSVLSTYTAKRLKESEKIAADASHELETIIQMNEHIIRSMRTGIIVIRNDGLILMTNSAALELLGQVSINLKSNLRDVSVMLYNRFIDWNNDTIQNHQPIPQAQGLPDIQPGFSHIDPSEHSSGTQQGRTLIFIEDATQLALRFQQVKLASLGRLTASIAHEIRNPLAAINHAGQLLGETSADEADKKLTDIINSQAKRLNGIVENVLQLSRQQRGTPETIKLLQWLKPFRDECISTHSLEAYQIQILIEPHDIEISFDSSQLHQVMWNLCSNAINHSNMDISNIMIIIQGGVDDKTGQTYIDIIDNGQGIDEDTQTHIFDPFFTTSSEGTGLGLYITKEVIESNRAKIRHIPPAAGGTCFRIYFQQAF